MPDKISLGGEHLFRTATDPPDKFQIDVYFCKYFVL